MDMEHIAAGEYAGQGGSQSVCHLRAAGDAAELHSSGRGQLIFRQQTHGQQQRVTGDVPFRAGDGLALFVNLRQCHALQPLPAVDVHHGGGQIQGDVKILQTLHDVALEAAGVGENFRHGVNLRSLQGHAAGHNEANVAAAQNDHIFPGHKALHIHKPLGGSGGVDARRAVAGDVQGAPGPFPAAHSQDHSLCPDLGQSCLRAGDGEHTLR